MDEKTEGIHPLDSILLEEVIEKKIFQKEYIQTHEYIRKILKEPNRCDCCGLPKEKTLDLANLSGEYKKELNDWVYLCKKCHGFLDSSLDRCEKYLIRQNPALLPKIIRDTVLRENRFFSRWDFAKLILNTVSCSDKYISNELSCYRYSPGIGYRKVLLVSDSPKKVLGYSEILKPPNYMVIIPPYNIWLTKEALEYYLLKNLDKKVTIYKTLVKQTEVEFLSISYVRGFKVSKRFFIDRISQD